jgi:hypothetical protein
MYIRMPGKNKSGCVWQLGPYLTDVLKCGGICNITDASTLENIGEILQSTDNHKLFKIILMID